jgi:addiction module HigA family antidote
MTIKASGIMARTPIHPGEILADELKEIGISAAELARTLQVPANRISQIVARKRAISADTALRLARYFGTTPDFWMNLQKTYELDVARQQLGKAIGHIPQRPDALDAPAAQRWGVGS